MASYTTNYQLHQWVPGDNFLRTDFNDDFLIVDNAIKAVSDASASGLASLDASKAEFVTGNYVGTGGTQSISLGFQPRAVLVSNHSYATFAARDSRNNLLEITSSGFSAVEQSSWGIDTPNTNGQRYAYMAMR